MVRQVEGTPPLDPREIELFDTMVMDVMEYVHGPAAKNIVEILDNSTDTSQSMANIVYKAVRGVVDKNAKSATIDMDMDIILGLTTEAIDMVTEIAGVADQLQGSTNVDQLKEDALLKVSVLHGEQLEAAGVTDEQRGAAQTDLRDYMADKGINKAFDYVNKRAAAEGVNPNDMMRAGNESVFGARKPVAEAVRSGLEQNTSPLMGQPAPPSLPPPPVGSDQGPPPPLPAPEQALMSAPPDMPTPLPQGEGLIPSGLPPAQDPNAALLPPGTGRR